MTTGREHSASVAWLGHEEKARALAADYERAGSSMPYFDALLDIVRALPRPVRAELSFDALLSESVTLFKERERRGAGASAAHRARGMTFGAFARIVHESWVETRERWRTHE